MSNVHILTELATMVIRVPESVTSLVKIAKFQDAKISYVDTRQKYHVIWTQGNMSVEACEILLYN